MARRIKPTNKYNAETRQDAEQLVYRLAVQQAQVNTLTLQMETHIHDVRERFAARIDAGQAEIDDLARGLEAWAAANPQEFPRDRKSIDFVHGAIGFRTGTPKVKKGRRFPNLEAVAEAMRKLPWARKYVKQAAPTVNKPALIADRDKLTAEQLNTLGLAIVQDESFFVEPKCEDLQQGVSVSDAA